MELRTIEHSNDQNSHLCRASLQVYNAAVAEPKRNVFVLAKLKFHMDVIILMIRVLAVASGNDISPKIGQNVIQRVPEYVNP